MQLYFITSNKNKFEELQSILGDGMVEQLDIDLPEIQDIDARNVIRAKLKGALNHREGGCIVEDTSIHLDCLNGLPGPFGKWFLKSIGNEGLVRLVQSLGNASAQATTIIGYAKNSNELKFFEGTITGKIVPARGTSDFGWDPIFEPDGHEKTFAEMATQEKNAISMRKIAAEKLKDYIHGE